MPLEKELAKFEAMKEELLKTYKDKFALFHEEEFVGAYDTAENAYEVGVQKIWEVVILGKEGVDRARSIS
jgi:hypothetical protein